MIFFVILNNNISTKKYYMLPERPNVFSNDYLSNYIFFWFEETRTF